MSACLEREVCETVGFEKSVFQWSEQTYPGPAPYMIYSKFSSLVK